MKELDKFFYATLKNDGQTFYSIRCYCDFEPFGRATEDWDKVYEITFPQIPAHYRGSDNKWHEIDRIYDKCQTFRADSLVVLESKAINFLKWYFGKEQ